MKELSTYAASIRSKVIQLSHQARTPHLGSSLSCADLIVALYKSHLRIDPQNAQDPTRDRFFLSKGHAVTTLYAVLAKQGFFPESELDQTYAEPGSRLPEHPSRNCVPGIEASTGSLGHGLGLATGVALANRIQNIDAKTFALLSDGECNEGSIWEAAMTAAALQLPKLCAIVDVNKWQATGRSAEVLALEPLHEKFASFGWETHRIDGHDFAAIDKALSSFPHPSGKPTAIIADTIKGKGVSFMEDDNNWHYRIPNADEVIAANKELGLA
ncbi:transketolase [Pelagicoccus enzymogenes]|uniref:transketolase n=1 Tax=Pelagicoccus enzymogenes TaxID=2773457 RepID=UPI00280F5BEB|nr:transketolase [Pelagicoccus enzymogenes]MDQ8199172.1 transketolase [Pelagicoccus enzymogenes]